METIRLLLADEHLLMRAALRQQLAQVNDLSVVAEADSLHQMNDLAPKTAPAVAIVDIELMKLEGINVDQPFPANCTLPRFVFLSTFDWDVYLAWAWKWGASAFVVKTCSIDKLIRIVHTVVDAGPA